MNDLDIALTNITRLREYVRSLVYAGPRQRWAEIYALLARVAQLRPDLMVEYSRGLQACGEYHVRKCKEVGFKFKRGSGKCTGWRKYE